MPIKFTKVTSARKIQCAGNNRQCHELGKISAAERLSRDTCGSYTTHHHAESNDECHKRNSECFVNVERRAGSLRVFPGELGIGRCGQYSEYKGEQKRQPEHASDMPPNLANQHVDARTQDVT
jgi:hypothetical protein